MFKIQIPKPCHEDWNTMTPTKKGAYCSACRKEVIDFTSMSDEDVQRYFLNKAGSNTCGRFREEQLYRIRIHLPEAVFIQKAAVWKKYMAVLLLTFGTLLFGCDVAIKNKAESKIVLSDIIKKTDEKNDKNANQRGYVGGLSFIYDSSSIKKDFSKEMQYVTYGYMITVDGTTDVKREEDTLQIKTDTSFITIPDTVLNTIPVSSDDTLMKKNTSDTSGCEGIGFY